MTLESTRDSGIGDLLNQGSSAISKGHASCAPRPHCLNRASRTPSAGFGSGWGDWNWPEPDPVWLLLPLVFDLAEKSRAQVSVDLPDVGQVDGQKLPLTSRAPSLYMAPISLPRPTIRNWWPFRATSN